MSYYELLDFSFINENKEPIVLKQTRSLEEAVFERNMLSRDGSVLKIVKKFEFKWQDSDIEIAKI